MKTYLRAVALLLASLTFSPLTQAGPLSDAIKTLDYDLLAATFDDAKIRQILGDAGDRLSKDEQQAAAVLVTLGALSADDLKTIKPGVLAERASRFVSVLTSDHPALMGRISDTLLYQHMQAAWDHQQLLAEDQLTTDLAKALNEGVITGYDLRRRAVYDNLPSGLTFIYSHSNLEHMRQLVTLLASENVNGWVSITPKVSAFLFREDWGPASDRVKTLPGGLKVVNGEEIAVMFQFDTRRDLARFHELIERFAKKDEKDEKGLITGAWWQPFYYTDQPFADFKKISLVVVSSDQYEATLTAVVERTDRVHQRFIDTDWDVRIDTVWVNPPFYRFLKGDYR